MKKTLAWLLTLFMVLTISSVTVFAAGTDVAKIGETGYATLTEAIDALVDGDTLTIFEGTYDAALTITESNVTVIGQGNVVLNGVPTLRGTNYSVENIDFNYSNGYNNLSGSGLIKDCTFTATENTFRYCYGATNGAITFEGTTFNPASGKWAVHFDSASGTDLTFKNCVINGRVALASDLGSLTATGTEFNNSYVNVWGTEDGATFEKCEFNDVLYVFTGYDADNTVDFNDCTVVKDGNSANVADIIYGGIDNADAKIYEDEVLIGGGVAKIGTTQFETLAEALAAAKDGETIVVNSPDTAIVAAGSVYGKTVTITGTAKFDWSQGWLFVGRGGEGNGTLIFENATITSGSNSSSYGIHVSGREKGTNNKYDGNLVIKNSSVELDYLINRNNIEVDNSTFIVKNGFGIAGRPATETESGAAATATIDIKNGSTVKVLSHGGMGIGVASSVKEGNGVLNLTDSTFECANFNIDADMGDFNVYGESVLKIAALTGKEIDLQHNAIIKDSTVGGEVMLYGKVTFRGDNTFAMLYDYGNAYSTEYAEWIVEKGASVTLTEKARYGLGYGDKLTIYGNIVDALNARAGLTQDDISVFMHGLVGMSSWNVDHSMTVKDAYVVIGSNNSFGNTAKSGYSGTYTFTFDNTVLDSSRITFYESASKTDFTFNKSDVNVGTFMIRDTDTVFTLTDTKLVSTTATNGTDEGNYLAGTLVLNNSSLSYAAPLVMENGTLTLDATSSLTAPSITGIGKIVIDATNYVADTQIINADMSGFTGTVEVTGNDDVYAAIEGGQLVLKSYVAQIGDVKYPTLQAAIDAAVDGDTIVVLKDVTVTTPAHGQNALNYAKAVDCVIDLNGKTLTADTGNSVFRFNISGSTATSNVTVTMKNGKVVAGPNTWCAVMATGLSADAKAIFNLENLTIENSKPGDLAVKAWSNSVINATNVVVNSTKGAGCFYAVGGEMVLTNCTATQEGLHTAPYLSMAFAVSDNGKLTVNSGNYSSTPTAAAEGNNQGTSHGSWVGGVMNSGGTLIINDGTFANGNFDDDSLATAARGLLFVDTYASLEVNGGTFNALKSIIDYQNNLGIAAGNPVVTLKGGTYSADPSHATYKFIADDYRVNANTDGTFTVAIIPYVAQVGSVKYESLADAIAAAVDGDTVLLIDDITTDSAVAISKKITLDLNGKTITGVDNATVSFGLININPGAELTITGNGKITLTAANNRAWNAYSSVISNQRGKLIVENGTIEHLGGTDMAYGIDNLTNGKGTYAETVINGGTIKSTYRAIRQFLNGVEAQNILTINAGTVYGENTGVFFHDPSANANSGTLTIAEGAQVNGVYLFVTAGSTEWPVEVSIAGSAIGANGLTSKNVPEGYEIVSVGGNYGVYNGVAKIGTAYYETLEAAFAAAANNSTVTMITDVNAAVTYAVSKNLTLDLNGYTIESDATATLTATAGRLTIVDSSADQTGAIIGAKAIHSSAYVAIQSGKFVGTITTENNQADDSQVCITGGNFSVEPDANLLEHCYISVENEDGTFSVIEDEYEVIINANGGVVTGAGFYKFGETVYIYADKNGNYTFAGWLSEDVEIMNPGERLASFVMPDHEVVVTAYWASNGTTTPVIPVMRGTIHFETNGGSAINSYTGTYGAKVDLAQFVTIRQGYTFAGWYSDAALSKPVTQLTLGGTKTVYAGWIETPVIPDVPVVVLPFTDVAADAYYYNAVLWAVGMGITNGISDTAFGPDMVCTRAQVVTFLWRAAGCPVAQNDDMPFADVTRDMYYYDAVLWAVEQGITNGISDTEFGPDAECSRAQIVTFLWRSQGSPAVEADGEFHDVDADAYYATAVEWAVDNGVTNGVGDDAFAPDAECTRAQTVTFLYRHFCK